MQRGGTPRPSFRHRLGSAVAAIAVLLCALAPPADAQGEPKPASFVRAQGTRFVLGDQPFNVAGVNNHYLTFGSEQEVLRVLDDAVAIGANVVRTFLQPVIGSPNGSMPTIWDWKSTAETSNLGVHGHYLLYWDTANGGMAINTGPKGMEKVDFLLEQSAARGLKLIISFLDFWAFTGGAQQIRAWYGSQDQYGFFFTDPRPRQDYRDWVTFVLNRKNPRTGIVYKEDPTIFAWELMNEPYARPDRLRETWIAEMSAFVKQLDPNHMVTSGHANVYNKLSDIAIKTIDFATWHGYPKYYDLTPMQFGTLITEFCAIGRKHDKPVVLEEFGYARSNPDQIASYRRWLDILYDDRDCAGWLVWRLVSRQDRGTFPVDNHDQFDVRNDGGELWSVLKEAAQRFKARLP